MKIALIFNKDRADTTGCYLERAMRQTAHTVRHFWTQDAHKIAPVYDLYLRIDHGDYKYDVPEHLRPSAFYAIDTHLDKPFTKIQEQARHYDFVFCAQRDGVAKLHRAANIRAHWIPVACDPGIHRPLRATVRRYDIGFVGTMGKNNPRESYLDLIHRQFPESFIGRTTHTRLSRVYARSKIGFNYSIRNDINMRMFEVLASGTFLLTNVLKNNGMDELFEDGKHLMTYHDQEEFLALARKYLTDDASREKIAQSGCLWVLAHHTYRHRLKQMFDIMRKELLGRYARLAIL